MASLHFFYRIVELFLQLLSLGTSLALLLIFLVDKFLLKCFSLMDLLLQPCLLLNNELLLALLQVLLMLSLFLTCEFFTQGMSLSILALLNEPFKDLLVLEQLGGLFEPESLVKLSLVILSQFS